MNKKLTYFSLPFTSSRSFTCRDRNELRGRGFATRCNFLQFQRKLRPENSLERSCIQSSVEYQQFGKISIASWPRYIHGICSIERKGNDAIELTSLNLDHDLILRNITARGIKIPFVGIKKE